MDEFVRIEKALLTRVAATLTSIGTPGCRSLAAEVAAAIETRSEVSEGSIAPAKETTPSA